MTFNPGPLKESQEVIFLRIYPDIIFNVNPVKKTFLDSKLNLDENIEGILVKNS